MQNMRRGCACQQHPVSVAQNRASKTNPIPAPTAPSCLTGMESLAMVYPPCQQFGDRYETEEALKNGTLFRDLNMPFREGYGRRGDGQ